MFGATACKAETMITANEPIVENNTIKYLVNGNDESIFVVAVLYDENKIPVAVRVNQLTGEFEAAPNHNYMMKIYAWERNSPAPVAQSLSFENLKTGAYEMTEYLNNTLKTSDGMLHYTYYLPKNYDESKSYPMLMTLPGWSNRFNTITTTPLTENSYAKSQAEVWSELLGDMIVVSPNLTDWGDKSARQTVELTKYFLDTFSVDTTRIYAAGFSAGGETLSRVVDKNPNLFAAYLHCATQWDGGYENVAENDMPVYITMAENDEYYGSDTAKSAYTGIKTAYEKTEKDSDDYLVLDIKADSYFPQGTASYHGGGYIIAHDKDIIRWLIGHKNNHFSMSE